MKDIGESFKLARESIGLSKSEVMKDLEINESQLDNLEDGNVNAFKDIFFLKDLIKKYTVYLNLDEDKIMDEFNSFIFSYTSRIPISDILEKTKEINLKEKQEDDKIKSPYTINRVKKEFNKAYIFLIVGFIFVFSIFFTVKYLKKISEERNLEYSVIVKGELL
ncbi:MAG: helix-turn-helix domain-containing protein [Bacilli bacterium]|nr:helix-turn-helix domain-containing protein [Bacilli bacterium]